MPKKLKYGEGSISLRSRTNKDGSIRRFYQGRIYINGKQYPVYAHTQKECLEKMKQLREDLTKQTTVTEVPTYQDLNGEENPLTYAEWLDIWLIEFKKRDLRPGYFTELCREVDKVKATLGDLKLNKMKPMELLRYINSLPRSNSTVKVYDIINGSLQRAEDFEVIPRNPCRAIKRPTYDKEKRRAFELEEQQKIMQALSDRYQKVFFFLCCTGLRIGEFLALDISRIDFDRGFICVEASRDLRTGESGKTKTAAGMRKVYFSKELWEYFDIKTLGTYTYYGIKKAFTKVYAALGIEGVSATHSCRHTYASMLYAAGVSDKVIQRQCGHAEVGTTMNVYTDILLRGESLIFDYILNLKKVLSDRFQMQ